MGDARAAARDLLAELAPLELNPKLAVDAALVARPSVLSRWALRRVDSIGTPISRRRNERTCVVRAETSAAAKGKCIVMLVSLR
jgi:hypothetical protein